MFYTVKSMVSVRGGSRICQGGGVGVDHGDRRARAYNGGLGSELPAGCRGRAPDGDKLGEAPLKLKAFCPGCASVTYTHTDRQTTLRYATMPPNKKNIDCCTNVLFYRLHHHGLFPLRLRCASLRCDSER